MTTIDRRATLKLIAGGATLAGSGLAAPAVWGQSMTKVRIGVVPVLDGAAFYVAQAQGLFAKERLEVEITPTPGGGPSIAALVSGQLQFAMSTVTTMIAGVAEGIDIKLVTSASGARPWPNDYSAVLVRKEAGIKTGKDIIGKTGASHLLQNLPWICMRLWIDGTGGDSSKAKIIEVQFPQQQDALLQGRVDYVATNEPFMSAAVQAAPDKLEIVSGLMGTMLPNTIVAALAASGEYAEKNKALVEGFVRAYAQAAEWTQGHKNSPDLLKIVSGYTRLPESRLQSLIAWPEFGRIIDPASLARIAEAMQRYGALSKLPDTAGMVYGTARA